MLHFVLALALLAGPGYVAFLFWRGYRASIGTTWQRAIAAAKGSASILWNGAVAVASAALIGADQLAQMLGWPEAQQLVGKIPPQYAAAAGLAFAAVGILARLRSLLKAA